MGRKKQLGQQRRLDEQNKQIQKQKENKRNAFVVGAVTLTGCLILGYNAIKPYFSKNQQTNTLSQISLLEQAVASSELLEARANPEKRQQYLNNLLTNSKMPYVSEVIYDGEDLKILDYCKNLLSEDNLSSNKMEELLSEVLKTTRKSKNHAQTLEIFDFNGHGIKPPIFVRSKIFRDKTKTDEDIKHIIAVHEARHAEQFARGLKQLGYTDEKILLKGIEDKTVDKEILYGIGEIDALNKELQAIESGNSTVSKTYYEDILRGYRAGYRTLIAGLKIPPGIQRDLIKSALNVNPPR